MRQVILRLFMEALKDKARLECPERTQDFEDGCKLLLKEALALIEKMEQESTAVKVK